MLFSVIKHNRRFHNFKRFDKAHLNHLKKKRKCFPFANFSELLNYIFRELL